MEHVMTPYKMPCAGSMAFNGPLTREKITYSPVIYQNPTLQPTQIKNRAWNLIGMATFEIIISSMLHLSQNRISKVPQQTAVMNMPRCPSPKRATAPLQLV